MNEQKKKLRKPHVYFKNGRWYCNRPWSLRKYLLWQAPSADLLKPPKEIVDPYNVDSNLFIQDDVWFGWREYVEEAFYYQDNRARLWYEQVLGLALFVH